MGEVGFYARQLGITPEDALEAIYTDPEALRDRLRERFPSGQTPLLELDSAPNSDSATDPEREI